MAVSSSQAFSLQATFSYLFEFFCMNKSDTIAGHMCV